MSYEQEIVVAISFVGGVPVDFLSLQFLTKQIVHVVSRLGGSIRAEGIVSE